VRAISVRTAVFIPALGFCDELRKALVTAFVTKIAQTAIGSTKRACRWDNCGMASGCAVSACVEAIFVN
jgi:hypothetical protein